MVIHPFLQTLSELCDVCAFSIHYITDDTQTKISFKQAVAVYESFAAAEQLWPYLLHVPTR